MYLFIHTNAVRHVPADERLSRTYIYINTYICDYVFTAHIKFTGLRFDVALSNFSEFKEWRVSFISFTVEIFLVYIVYS